MKPSVWKNAILQFIFTQKYWIFVLISSWAAADLMVLYTLPFFISETRSFRTQARPAKNTQNQKEYTAVWDFNIFHDGGLPPSLSLRAQTEANASLGPQLSLLPLQLNGTIVYRNPDYSIANITVKNKAFSEVYQVQDTIENLARITHIDSERVYFINLNNSREEYIQITKQNDIHFSFQKSPRRQSLPAPAGNALVKDMGNFQFQVQRSDINQYLRSLPSILQDAKVIPHIENGRMAGFRFKYIKSGSVYEQLGFKVSDVLTSVDGEKLKSELQATELFHRLKNRSKLDMVVKRKGENIPFSWTINEDSSIEEPPRID